MDARGSRVKLGYFVSGTEPRELCRSHILVEYDEVCGGIANVLTPENHIRLVGMLSIEREFPTQIIVSDAQYVYRELDSGVAPSLNANEAFFSTMQDKGMGVYFGISAGKLQFNRLSTAHVSASDTVFIKNLMRMRN